MFSCGEAKTYTFTEKEVLTLQHEMVNQDKKIDLLSLDNSYLREKIELQKKHYEELLELKEKEKNELLRISEETKNKLVMQYEALNAVQESRIADLSQMNTLYVQNIKLYSDMVELKDKRMQSMQNAHDTSMFISGIIFFGIGHYLGGK
jgi:hypothetical protein